MRQITLRRFPYTSLFVASFVVVAYTLLQLGDADYWTVDVWESLQRERLKLVEDSCPNSVLSSSGNILKDETLLKRLLYNDEHKIIYCHIPKIASTNWKRIFTVLNGRVNTTEPLDIAHEFVHRPEVTFHMSLWKVPHSERLRRLKTYKKFVFVRHPFERLLSAYKDKLRDNSSNSIENFQKVYGARMLRLYRPRASRKLITRGGDVTFPEFVRYLTDTIVKDRLAEPHWTPMSDLCKPCQIQYDYVGKYDTLLTDVNMILAKTNIVLPFSFPPQDNANSNTRKHLYSHMKKLTKEQFRQLYRTYKDDFQSFGYDSMDWGPK